MKTDVFSRTELLLGKDALKKLNNSRVAVFGVGGVGGFTVEALARSGVGTLDLIDKDTVDVTNLNRQIIALRSTIGRDKVSVAAERVRDINPDCIVNIHKVFFLPDTADDFNFKEYDYVVDAIDNVTGKLTLIEKSKKEGVPIISSMGTGNKLDPTEIKVADIYETSVCPLAKIVRKECKKQGIDSLKVVYSTEETVKPSSASEADRGQALGSVAFVPSVAGLIIASEVIKDIIKS